MGYDWLIAIDPGKKTGWAVFSAMNFSSRRVEWNLYEADSGPPQEVQEGLFGYARGSSFIHVVEKPRIYPRERKVDMNDLIDLAVVAGEFGGAFRPQGDVHYVYPRTWKGNVPKDVHHKRLLKGLTEGEINELPKRPRAKDYDHNMMDAVGIGLWWLRKEGLR